MRCGRGQGTAGGDDASCIIPADIIRCHGAMAMVMAASGLGAAARGANATLAQSLAWLGRRTRLPRASPTSACIALFKRYDATLAWGSGAHHASLPAQIRARLCHTPAACAACSGREGQKHTWIHGSHPPRSRMARARIRSARSVSARSGGRRIERFSCLDSERTWTWIRRAGQKGCRRRGVRSRSTAQQGWAGLGWAGQQGQQGQRAGEGTGSLREVRSAHQSASMHAGGQAGRQQAARQLRQQEAAGRTHAACCTMHEVTSVLDSASTQSLCRPWSLISR